MAKVTSQLQVTVPKVVADHFGIRPGDEIEWVIAGEHPRSPWPEEACAP